MGFSFVHLFLLVVIVGVVFGPGPFNRAGKSAGEFWRSLKRGYDGKEDIDITSSVRHERIDGDHD